KISSQSSDPGFRLAEIFFRGNASLVSCVNIAINFGETAAAIPFLPFVQGTSLASRKISQPGSEL
ncbi:hypothetical protein, partial [Massilia pseudoviolaceinigra]|uniref:hypothetical protein n=1 Tax=Massilia pseudoviolaceinigra TaxID=3057165 RepID=UPI0027965D49